MGKNKTKLFLLACINISGPHYILAIMYCREDQSSVVCGKDECKLVKKHYSAWRCCQCSLLSCHIRNETMPVSGNLLEIINKLPLNTPWWKFRNGKWVFGNQTLEVSVVDTQGGQKTEQDKIHQMHLGALGLILHSCSTVRWDHRIIKAQITWDPAISPNSWCTPVDSKEPRLPFSKSTFQSQKQNCSVSYYKFHFSKLAFTTQSLIIKFRWLIFPHFFNNFCP